VTCVPLSVSAVIPTRNRHRFLLEAVHSLLAQSSPPAEIIVVDDGEGAANALSGVAATLRVLDNQSRGPVAARTRGVASAKGDLIAFLDDDDWLIDEAYLEGAAGLIANGADLVFCDGTLMFEDGSGSEPFAFDADAKSLERNNTILISGVVYRRALHETLGGFDEALPFYWDWDWYLRVARGGFALKRVARPSVAIRVHAANMSGGNREAERRDNLDRFASKHGLAAIPLKNHLSLARETRPR
jgi:glycosyltransferase involved in cell wall biosynthesis